MGNVLFSQEDFHKIQTYTNLLPNSEIACMGYAELVDGDVKVNEVFLVPQVIDLMGVEFIETGFPYAVKKAVEEDRLDELRFCWHSHATHAAFFSSTDEEMVRKVRDAGPIPWFCSAILNGKGETHAQIDVFEPGISGDLAQFTGHVSVALDFTVEGKVMSDAEEEAISEIEHFCEKRSTRDKKKGKGPKGPAAGSTSKLGEMEGDVSLPLSSTSKWKRPTKRDYKLHVKARKAKWDCYCDDEDIAHYWSWVGTKFIFEGSAPIPLENDGSWKIEIDQTIVDSSALDADNPELKLIEPPVDEEEDALLAAMSEDELEKAIEERGQL